MSLYWEEAHFGVWQIFLPRFPILHVNSVIALKKKNRKTQQNVINRSEPEWPVAEEFLSALLGRIKSPDLA